MLVPSNMYGYSHPPRIRVRHPLHPHGLSMKSTLRARLVCCLLAWLACFGVQAQPISRIAVLSLVADSMTVVAYRPSTGSSTDTNLRRKIPISTPVLEQAVLAAVHDSARKTLSSAGVLMLAVPRAGAANDPNMLLADLSSEGSAAFLAALREQSVSHLVLVTPYRAPARMQFAEGKVGSGYVSGLGFYVDHSLPTIGSDANRAGEGFIAPYAYVQLTLVDVATATMRRKELVTASHAVAAERNRTGTDPWNALSTEEKFRLLTDLLVEGVSGATEALLKPN